MGKYVAREWSLKENSIKFNLQFYDVIYGEEASSC